MVRSINGCPHLIDAGGATGRGLVVNDAHGLDLMARVVREPCPDGIRIGTHPPVGFNELRLDAELIGHGLPEGGEMTRLAHQHFVAWRERVDESSFPGARARRRINDDRARAFENRLDAIEAAFAQRGEFRAPMVHRRIVHRPKNAVRNIRRSRNLQEMPASLPHASLSLTAAILKSPYTVRNLANNELRIHNACQAQECPMVICAGTARSEATDSPENRP